MLGTSSTSTPARGEPARQGVRGSRLIRRRLRRGPRRATAHDRGSVSAQILVAWPVVLTLLLLAIQAVIWAYASYAAQAAADRGVDAARALGGTSTTGEIETQQVLNQLDAGPLNDTQISVNVDAASATVRIDGHAQQIIPWLHLPVHAQATGPLEATGS